MRLDPKAAQKNAPATTRFGGTHVTEKEGTWPRLDRWKPCTHRQPNGLKTSYARMRPTLSLHRLQPRELYLHLLQPRAVPLPLSSLARFRPATAKSPFPAFVPQSFFLVCGFLFPIAGGDAASSGDVFFQIRVRLMPATGNGPLSP